MGRKFYFVLRFLALLSPPKDRTHWGRAFSAELLWMQLRTCAGLGSASFDSLSKNFGQTVYPPFR